MPMDLRNFRWGLGKRSKHLGVFGAAQLRTLVERGKEATCYRPTVKGSWDFESFSIRGKRFLWRAGAAWIGYHALKYHTQVIKKDDKPERCCGLCLRNVIYIYEGIVGFSTPRLVEGLLRIVVVWKVGHGDCNKQIK